MLTERALKWLDARGIDAETASRLGLKSCDRRGDSDWIAIPYLIGDGVVNHKYRNLVDKRFEQDKGGRQVFWNFNALTDPSLETEPVIITEGEFDAVIAIQCGYARTVSVPAGAPKEQIEDPDSAKYNFLTHARDAIKDAPYFILATDGDEPGIALMHDLAVRLGRARCKWVEYPRRRDGGRCKDLNEVFLEYGERGVRATLDRASWYKVEGVYKMSDLPPYPEPPVFSTHIEALAPHYNIRPGDLTVVTGFPGCGKSTLMNDICGRMAFHHNWRIAIASFEQHPQADHRRNLRAWFIQKPAKYLSEAEAQAADEWIDEHFRFIVPNDDIDDEMVDLPWLLLRMAVAVQQHNCRLIIIDPWNEIEHNRPDGMQMTEYVGRAIKEIKRFARAHNVHVTIVAHPAKPQASSASEIPSLYSIADSAHFYNKCDAGLVMHKPAADGLDVLVRVAKSRYHDRIGRPGDVWMRWLPTEQRFQRGMPPEEFEAAHRKHQKHSQA